MYSKAVLKAIITWMKALCKDGRYSSKSLPKKVARIIHRNGFIHSLEEARSTLQEIADALEDVSGEYAKHRRQRANNLLMSVECAISRQQSNKQQYSHSGKQVMPLLTTTT